MGVYYKIYECFCVTCQTTDNKFAPIFMKKCTYHLNNYTSICCLYNVFKRLKVNYDIKYNLYKYFEYDYCGIETYGYNKIKIVIKPDDIYNQLFNSIIDNHKNMIYIGMLDSIGMISKDSKENSYIITAKSSDIIFNFSYKNLNEIPMNIVNTNGIYFDTHVNCVRYSNWEITIEYCDKHFRFYRGPYKKRTYANILSKYLYNDTIMLIQEFLQEKTFYIPNNSDTFILFTFYGNHSFYQIVDCKYFRRIEPSHMKRSFTYNNIDCYRSIDDKNVYYIFP